MIGERIVLRRVQDFEECRCWIALERHSELVDFVQEEHRVLRSGALHPFDDPAGHGSHVCSAMAPNIGLVTRTAQGDADVLTTHRTGNRLCDRRFPNTWRADEQQDRALCAPIVPVPGNLPFARFDIHRLFRCFTVFGPTFIAQLANGEELQHTVFHVFQAVVILFENAGCVREVEFVFAPIVPRKFCDSFEERTNDLRLHRLAPGTFETAQFLVDLFACLLRKIELRQLLLEFFELADVVDITELFLDGTYLLAQEHLALTFAEFFLNFRFDVFLGVQQFELPLDTNQHTTQTLFDRERFQKRLPLDRRDFQVTSNEIRETPRIFDAFQHLLHHFLRQTGLDTEFRRALSHFLFQGDERGVFGVDRWKVGRLLDNCLDVTIGFVVLEDRRAVFTAQQQLNPSQPTLDLADVADDSRRVKDFGLGLLHVLPLADCEDQLLLGFQRRLDGSECSRPSGPNWGRNSGEENGFPQWKHWKALDSAA